MSTFPVRRLGATGIVTDAHPSDIEDVGTFTGGVNVRFKNGRASRAPVCRTIATLPHEPGHVLAIPPGATGYDEVVSVAEDFSTLYRLNGSTFDNLTPPGWVGGGTEYSTSNCFLGGLSYVNRESHVPIYKAPNADTYLPIPEWDDGDRCQVLRPYKDQLVALGVTKAGVYYPTMVKWSDFAYFGAPPQSWDPKSTTNSAGENIVNEMTHALVDGLSLGNSFILYCTASVWRMDYIGGDNIYSFVKLFDEIGVINPNCVVQVLGLHYVFDRNDIYVHDGVSPRSIADGKVKEFVFNALDFSLVRHCFVYHDAKMTEVRFCYPAGDRFVGFHNPKTGCNRQAVYNYSNDTWTFYDAPNLVAATKASLVSGASWDTDQDVSFDDAGGLWMTTEGDEDRHVLLVGRSDETQGLYTPRLFGFDLLVGGRLPYPPAPDCLRPSILERIGIDLDAAGKNIAQYMNLQAIWPQVSLGNFSDANWQFGGVDFVNKEPQWSDPVTFDPESEGKIDIDEAGRYLGYRFTCGGLEDFQLSGFDVQIVIRGRRT